MTEKKFELIARGRKQPKDLDRCPFVNEIGTFLNELSKEDNY